MTPIFCAPLGATLLFKRSFLFRGSSVPGFDPSIPPFPGPGPDTNPSPNPIPAPEPDPAPQLPPGPLPAPAPTT